MYLHKEEAGGEQACRDRAKAFIRWLLARPEQHIAVVSHGHFLRHHISLLPTEQLDDGGAEHRGRMSNAEIRHARICDGDGGDSSEPSTWRGIPTLALPENKRNVVPTSARGFRIPRP